jgi:hypothetical protein
MLVIALLSTLPLGGCGEGGSDVAKESEDPILARVGGEAVRRSEIERRAGWRLHRARLDV